MHDRLQAGFSSLFFILYYMEYKSMTVHKAPDQHMDICRSGDV